MCRFIFITFDKLFRYLGYGFCDRLWGWGALARNVGLIVRLEVIVSSFRMAPQRYSWKCHPSAGSKRLVEELPRISDSLPILYVRYARDEPRDEVDFHWKTFVISEFSFSKRGTSIFPTINFNFLRNIKHKSILLTVWLAFIFGFNFSQIHFFTFSF